MSGLGAVIASEAHAVTLAAEGLLGVIFTIATLTDEAIGSEEVGFIGKQQTFYTHPCLLGLLCIVVQCLIFWSEINITISCNPEQFRMCRYVYSSSGVGEIFSLLSFLLLYPDCNTKKFVGISASIVIMPHTYCWATVYVLPCECELDWKLLMMLQLTTSTVFEASNLEAFAKLSNRTEAIAVCTALVNSVWRPLLEALSFILSR
jgi:hypothetical protein